MIFGTDVYCYSCDVIWRFSDACTIVMYLVIAGETMLLHCAWALSNRNLIVFSALRTYAIWQKNRWIFAAVDFGRLLLAVNAGGEIEDVKEGGAADKRSPTGDGVQVGKRNEAGSIELDTTDGKFSEHLWSSSSGDLVTAQ